MSLSSTLDRLHSRVRKNKWFRYFAVFNRVALALGFLPSGFVKINGERFTDLAVHHPMGHYLDAFYQTGFYYTSVGIMQMTAAILLLIPRTATLGAVIYFPIILNIFILTLAVRFDGSWLTAPLMVLANLYLLCWDYHKIKFILPLGHSTDQHATPAREEASNKFPKAFFAGVIATVFAVVMTTMYAHNVMIMPRNNISFCKSEFRDGDNSEAGYNFCNCIHIDGRPLYSCLSEYEKALKDTNRNAGFRCLPRVKRLLAGRDLRVNERGKRRHNNRVRRTKGLMVLPHSTCATYTASFNGFTALHR